MARSYVERRGKEREPALALYMPGIREYMMGDLDEREVKEAIRKVGGTVNDSGVFLRPTSEALVVTSATGINRRSVVYIPRSKVPEDILCSLDRCKFHPIVLHGKYRGLSSIMQCVVTKMRMGVLPCTLQCVDSLPKVSFTIILYVAAILKYL